MSMTLIQGLIFWITISTIFFFIWENRKLARSKSKAELIISEASKDKENVLNNARKEADNLLKEARKESDNIIREARKEASDVISKSEKLEERILEKETKIEKKLEEIEKKQESISKQEDEFKNRILSFEKKEKWLENKISEIAKLTEEEARVLFLEDIKKKYSDEWFSLIEKYKKDIDKRKKEEAREIILKSIQQYAWDITNEVTTTIIPLSSEDLKWKLIWKEWRNITTFEKCTWVSLIIDDTPDSVFISWFDLFRRYVAKKSLEKLIEDWRIQPARIEEIVENTEKEAESLLRELWTKTLEELNITNLPDEIVPIIWKLRFRTSYWQNILKHSKEVALIAEQLAKDLWADPYLIKIWWLLHDIGKALDQEIEWTHPEIWWKVARKYKLNEKVVDMIENHHWEQFVISLEAAIVQVADAISSVRPWARREAIEEYLKRIKEMEALVQSFSWVNKAYALSAWREIRVFVDAHTVSDLDAQEMARTIAENIQENLSYPWEIKINLIREMRVIEYAK